MQGILVDSHWRGGHRRGGPMDGDDAASQQQPPLSVEKLADDLHVIVGSGGNVAVSPSEGSSGRRQVRPQRAEILEKCEIRYRQASATS